MEKHFVKITETGSLDEITEQSKERAGSPFQTQFDLSDQRAGLRSNGRVSRVM